MPRTHHLPDEHVHFTWDAGNEPVLVIDSGDTVVVWTRDVSDNQIGAGLGHERDRRPGLGSRVPAERPDRRQGRPPGDTLAVEILDIHTQGWGWTAILPGLGLLADDFPDAYLRDLRPLARRRRLHARGHRDPAEPFFGTMGVCPAGASAAAGDAARHLRRQHGHPPARARLDAVPAGPGRAARCSRAATPTAPRATARSA